MKKIFYVFVAAVVCATNVYAAKTYDVKHDNDRRWGAKVVTETEYPGGQGYSLVCKDPGDLVCQFKDGHCPPKVKLEQLTAEVINAIALGQLAGKTETEYGYYTWEATDVDHYHIVITDLQDN